MLIYVVLLCPFACWVVHPKLPEYINRSTDLHAQCVIRGAAMAPLCNVSLSDANQYICLAYYAVYVYYSIEGVRMFVQWPLFADAVASNGQRPRGWEC